MNTNTLALDLVAIIERYSPTRLQRKARHYKDGDEYAGACPWCKGNDRFLVWLSAERPHYYCRICQKSGDAIQFLRDFCDLSYHESCAELQIEPGQDYTVRRAAVQGQDGPPPKAWQAMARGLVHQAEKYLWSPGGKAALDYLHHTRGLDEEIIELWHLGYVPLNSEGRWFSRPFADWGLTDDLLSESQRAKGGVRVPNGILIPWFYEDQLYKLTVKRFEATGNELKYGQVLGSRECLYNAETIHPNRPVLLCEAVLDALSAQQEAGSLIGCVATDSVTGCRSGTWIAKLATASSVLIAFDDDAENQAGDTASQFWLDVLGKQALRWTPWSHDINDMHTQQKDIKQWVQLGIDFATMPVAQPVVQQPEPAAPPARRTIEDIVADYDARLAVRIVIEADTSNDCSQGEQDASHYNEQGVGFCTQHWTDYNTPPACFAERPCSHCGGYEARRDTDGTWMCLCWFEPQRRRSYALAGVSATVEQKPKNWDDYRR